MTGWIVKRIGNVGCLLAAFTLAATAVWAQQAPSTQDGPMSIAPTDAMPRPRPYSDGTYPMAPGIVSPKILRAVDAAYPVEVPGEGAKSTCVISLVVGADGVPANVHVVHSAGEAFDAAATAAVKESKFEPGSLDGQPIPVRTHIRVHFSADHSAATPAIFQMRYRGSGDGQEADFPPAVLHSVDPVYSDEARRKKIKGTVLVSALVTEEGVPTDLRVDRSLGYGLDEKAVECVSQYRFRPAQKDGKPVAARVNVMVAFQLY
jgi:TonB family protein